MKREVLCFLSALLFVIAPLFSQTYHAAALWDAKGNVKEIKYSSTKDPLLKKKKIKFDENGKLKNSFIVYGNAGLPLGMDFNAGLISLDVNFEFHNIDLIKAVLKTKNGKSSNIIDIVYNFENGLMASENAVSKVKGKNEKQIVMNYKFRNYSYDSLGNWLSRDVILEIQEEGRESETKQYTEKREIKYWE